MSWLTVSLLWFLVGVAILSIAAAIRRKSKLNKYEVWISLAVLFFGPILLIAILIDLFIINRGTVDD